MKTKNPKTNYSTTWLFSNLILWGMAVFLNQGLFCQANFTAQDTICIDDSLAISNLSENANSYYWNFCSGNLAYSPEGENLTNTGSLDGPAFIDFAVENDTYFAFITNHNAGTLTRNFYGDNFLSDPLSMNMGDFGGIIPAHVQGIQVVNESGNWYVFIVGGQREDSRLVRLDFGGSLTNNSPSAHNLGRIGDLDYPVDLFLTKTSGAWLGFTVNKNTGTISRFEFNSGINNPPLATNIGNIGGINSPCGILATQENNNWFMFISNYDGHDITRLEFGNSLLSTPTGTSIGDDSFLHYPFDLTIIRDCERTYGFVLNRFNDIVRLEFNDGLENEPTFTSLGEIGDLYNPQGISDVFRVGDSLYAFVANIDNSTITRLFFPGCTNASPSSSEERNPPPVRYNEPGLYNVNLVINEGQPNQDNYCMNIVVLEAPNLDLGNDTTIAAGTSIELYPDTSYTTYQWSTGSTEESITVSESDIYTLSITNEFGCKSTDDKEVIVDIGIPNFFTPNEDGYNDTWEIPFLSQEPETEIWIYDRYGNMLIYYKAGEMNWNGVCNNSPLPTGTYWYIIKVPGSKKPYKGSVTIKR